MNAMCLFRCSTCAPSTVQYQSIIWSRRLVCSTRCDSFFGDGMVSSLAARRRCARAGPPSSVHPKPGRVNRNAAAQARAVLIARAALQPLIHFLQASFQPGAVNRVELPLDASLQLASFLAQIVAALAAPL